MRHQHPDPHGLTATSMVHREFLRQGQAGDLSANSLVGTDCQIIIDWPNSSRAATSR